MRPTLEQYTYENEKCVRLDETFERQKLAYVFTLMKDDIYHYLRTHAITCQVKVTDEEYNIDLFCQKRPTPDRIITLLRDKLNDIEYFCINLNAQEGQNVKHVLHNRPTTPKPIRDKKAIVLRHGMMLHCVAGNVDHLDNLLIEMNYNETEVTELADYPINLSALGIQKSSLHQNVLIEIQESEQKCVITWKDEKTKTSFREEALKVLFDQDGTMNETYWAYLKKEGVRKGKKCTHFALTQNDNSIVLYGRGENISFLKTNIDNSLSRLDLPNIFFRSKEGRKFLTKYKNKLTYNLMTGVVVCTQDLRDNLLQISQSSRDKMSSKGFGYYSAFVVDILQKRAGKELSRLKEEFDIDFQMNDRSITLYIEEGRSSLKKGVMDSVSKLKACTKVDLALSGLDFAQVGKVMDVHHCSWKMFSEGEMKCMGSDECRFVWMDPYRATKLSLLQIDKCTPYVDIWIELTTDELQPLGLNPNSQDHRLLSGHNRKTNDKRVGYTEVVNGPFPTSCVLAGCSMVLAIVVRADIDETNSDVIENKTLRGIFVNALEKSRHVQRNVCLNAVFAQKDPELALADVISQFIMAIDTVSKQARPEFTQKVSIIVDEKELEVAKRLIESRMSKNVMVCDKPHVFEKKTRSESHLKLMVIVGTITDSKCDAIVNTTNKRLDLSQGFVSKEISKLAGNGLKEECEQFYPNDRDSKRSYGDQIELIANAHGRMLEQGNVYHQKAVILVPDIAAVTSFREKEKAKEESLWSWDECLDAVMVVVGPSEAHTLKANEQVAKMIEEKKKSIMRQQGPKADEEDRQVGTESILHGNGKKTLAKNTRRLFPQFRPRLIPELCGS
ncbi:hypothetical protein MAR_015225 [Mya arenaria]|uniref:Uncharacterized protein n=1 Tax=Mya arenaria TaxID=6604 RepID=A0ABY7FPY7_MYAAR|nr:hypothetical protein MAR_015225 [Mya arenaria]